MCFHHHGKKFLVGDGLLLLRNSPRACEPEAGEVGPQTKGTGSIRCKSTAGHSPGYNQKLTPCHWAKRWSHHCRSRWNSLLNWMGWSFLRKQLKRSIIRWRDVLPGHTTLAAWCKWPMSDSSLHLKHPLRGSHEWISSFKDCSFSSGRCATWVRESNSMPWTASSGVCPTHFPGWRGKPKRSQTNNTVLRFCAHWGESGGPAVMKSSK